MPYIFSVTHLMHVRKSLLKAFSIYHSHHHHRCSAFARTKCKKARDLYAYESDLKKVAKPKNECAATMMHYDDYETLKNLNIYVITMLKIMKWSDLSSHANFFFSPSPPSSLQTESTVRKRERESGYITTNEKVKPICLMLIAWYKYKRRRNHTIQRKKKKTKKKRERNTHTYIQTKKKQNVEVGTFTRVRGRPSYGDRSR